MKTIITAVASQRASEVLRMAYLVPVKIKKANLHLL